MNALIGGRPRHAVSTRSSRIISRLLVAPLVGVLLVILAAGGALPATAVGKAQADKLCEEAGTLAEQGDDQSAHTRWEQALAIYQGLRLEEEEADTLISMAWLADSQSEWRQAVEHGEQALAIYKKLGMEKEQQSTLLCLGGWLTELREYQRAQECLDESLALCRKLGIEKSGAMGEVLFSLGGLARASSRYDESMAYLKQALAIYEEVGDARGAMNAQQQIGFTFNEQGLRWHIGGTPAQEISPDSSEVLFGSEGDWPPTQSDILKSNLDGSGEVNLTKTAGIGGVNSCPTWSPDGTMIAFQHCDPVEGLLPCKAGFHVWVMKADGSGAHPLLPEGSEPSVGPSAWSPDGSRLVVARGDPHDQAQASIVVDLSGAVIGQVLPNERGPCCPEGCPLAFVDQRRGEVDGRAGWWNRLIVEDADGTNRRTAAEQFIADADLEGRYPTEWQLDEAPDLPWLDDVRMWVGPYSPTHSPNHTKIAFLAALPFDPDGLFYKDQVEVWVYDVSADELTRVTNDSVQQHGLEWLKEGLPYPREAMRSHQALGATLQERGDLLGAIEHLQAAAGIAREQNWPREEADHLVSMAQAAHGLARYEEAIGYLQQALPLYEDTGLLPGVIDAHRWLGFSIRDQGDLQGALEQFQMAAEIARDENWPDEEAGLLMEMALAVEQKGDTERTVGCYREVIAIYRRLGRWEEELGAVLALSRMLRDRGDLKAAEAWLEQARELYRGFGSEKSPAAADVLFSLGEAAHSVASRYDEAMDYLSQALAMYEDLGDPSGAMNAHQHLGFTLQEQGDPRGAIEHYGAAAAIAREQGWPADEAQHIEEMAGALGQVGDFERAIGLCREAAAIYRRLGSQEQEVNAVFGLFRALRDSGDLKGAEACLEEARELYRGLPAEASRARADALLGLGEIAESLSTLEEAIDYHSQALAVYEGLGDHRGAMNAHQHLGYTLMGQGKWQEALNHFDMAATIAREQNWPDDEARRLFETGQAANALRRYGEAASYLQQALDMYGELGLQRDMISAHQWLGFTLRDQGNNRAALEQLQMAAGIAREHDWAGEEADTLARTAELAMDMGDQAKAVDLYKQVIAIYERFPADDALGTARLLEGLGLTAGRLGRYSEAMEYLGQALAVFEKLGMKRDVMNMHQHLGYTLQGQGDPRGALEHFEAATRIAREQSWPNEEAGRLMEMAGAVGQIGELARAVGLYEEAIAIYRRMGLREQEVNTLFDLLRVLRDKGDLKRAAACLEQALELYRGLGAEKSPAAADVLFSLGEAAHTVTSRYDEAIDYLNRALVMYEELGDPRGAMNAHQHLGFTLHEQDDLQGALTQYEAAAAIAREQNWFEDEAHHLMAMAGAAQQTGDRERAIGLWRQAIAIYERLGLVKQQVQHTLSLAGALRSKGELQEAEASLEQARQLCQKLEPEGDRAEALRWLADQEQGFSQEDQAQAHREEALAIYQRLGWRYEEARTQRQIGRRLAELGKYEEAQAILQSALALCRELGLERSADMGQVLLCLAVAARNSFRYDEAMDYLEQVLALYQELADPSETMHAHRWLGFTLRNWQHYPEALAQFEMAAAIARQHNWPLREADTLVAMAGTAMQMDDRERAIALYREAAAIHHETGDLAGEVRTLCTLAGALRKAGNQSEGEAYLEQARELCRKLPAQRDLADALRLIAGAEIGFSQDHQARQHREQALAIYQKLGLREDEAGTLSDAGGHLADAGRFREAQDFLEQSLAIYGEVASKQAQASVLNQLGVVAFRLGEYEQSSAYFGQCIAIHQELGQRETPSCALPLLNQGCAKIHLGDYAGGIALVEEALAIYRKAGLRQPLADIHLGLAACHQGEYDKAQDHLEKALASARELGDRQAEGRALGILSMRAMGVGQHRQGVDYAEKAVSVFRRHGPRFREADQLSTLGSAAAQAGQYDTASRSLAQAREVYGTLRFDHAVFSVQMEEAQLRMDQLRLPEAREILDDAGEPLDWGPGPLAAWHLAWGRYHYLTGVSDEALTRFEQAGAAAGADSSQLTASQIGLGLAHEALGSWEQAVAAYSRAVELSEQSRTSTAAAERVRFFEARAVCFRRLEAYEGLVRVLHRMRRDEDAFFWSEHTKARVLVEAMARAPHGSRLGLPAELRMQEGELSNRIAALSSSAGEDESSQQQLKRVLADRDALVARLRLEYPEYASMQYPLPLRAGELSLAPNEVLLAYEVTEPESYLFIVRAGEVERVYEIKLSRPELAALVEGFRSSFAEVASAGDLRALDLSAGEELYNLLLRPALAGVAADEHVIIVPDEVIGLVPLEALVVHADGGAQWRPTTRGPSPTGVEYVGDTHAFTYWQSGTTMTTVRQLRRDVPGDRVLLVADPALVFPAGGVPAALEAGAERTASVRGDAGRMLRGGRSKGLSGESTGSHQLTESLRQAYGERVSFMPGVEATKAVLQRAPLDQYAVLVFATHGVVSDGPPGWGQPALMLSGADGRPGEDGHLTMTDVMDLHIRAEIVCLMACDTGAGELAGGEGIMAMGRAFQYAGARSVLVSLWKVEDESANLLARVFLQEMAAGRPKLEALQSARRRVRESGHEHPFFWAPFVLIGEDEVARAPGRPAGCLASTPLS